MQVVTDNLRQDYDSVIQTIADYVCDYKIDSKLAFDTAKLCLLDSIGCLIKALEFKDCTKLLGPWLEGGDKNGIRVLGTNYKLDPIKAAFDLTCMIRWLDFNDTWLAKEWGHPSDNIGGILSAMLYANANNQNYTVNDLLTFMIKAYEIQGILALENSFNSVGLDHVILVKVSTAALTTHILGGSKQQVMAALSQAFVDGQALRTYRHAPNTGSRKSWAAADATSRGLMLALITLKGENGYPSVLTAKNWGFYDCLFKSSSFKLPQDFGSYVMENILFKVAYPAEFHAQTAVEAAVSLHPEFVKNIDYLESITIYTQQAGYNIINKRGPLYNPADRDHCLQYMVAVALLTGDLIPSNYQADFAQNPAIDKLRSKMAVFKDPNYTEQYFDYAKRAIPNRLEIKFNNSDTALIKEVLYPLGHKTRRSEAFPKLNDKFKTNLKDKYAKAKIQELLKLFEDNSLNSLEIEKFVSAF